jgi:squalene-hopene/tetraprenyl-beta-curcumene cyclase
MQADATLLEDTVARASAALSRRQNADGHWVFPLEADATIPAEYVLLEHFLDRIDQPLQDRIGVYLPPRPPTAAGHCSTTAPSTSPPA